MHNRYALIGILVILVVSIGAVVYLNSVTGSYSSNYRSASKIYGGAIKRAYKDNPGAFGSAYAKAVYIQRNQDYLYANRDKWDCTFGKEAETSSFPCMYQDDIQKYCCIVPSTSGSPSSLAQ